jgi:polysaccharide export outer membrane protein
VILTPNLPTRTIVPPPTSVSPFEESYTLGPSDEIQLDIFNVPELSGATTGRYIVQLDGTINLLWAGTVSLQGLTLRQAEDTIEAAYRPFIREPMITVSLVNTRSLRISVAGEVKRPGAYVISPEGATDNRILVETGGGTGGGVANQWPTVTKAIQAAGGLTQFADLRRVQLRRPRTDGSLEIVDINLWELLRAGELNQDVRLRDRDSLVIPTATTLNDNEALVLGAANFSPETIRVNVIGEVPNPGLVEIPPNTPMNQALLAAGGFLRPRARTSRVELVRLNSNGTAIRRTVEIDLAAGINEASNPALRDYDTIIVSRNGSAVFSDNLDFVLEPIERTFGIVNSIFGIVNTIDDLGSDDGDDDDDDTVTPTD